MRDRMVIEMCENKKDHAVGWNYVVTAFGSLKGWLAYRQVLKGKSESYGNEARRHVKESRLLRFMVSSLMHVCFSGN